ncbi:MAG: hypothetical protein K2J02_00305 [Malacoplasma sp.]|nr:hypothetical protein [Malacoplasma sp.]
MHYKYHDKIFTRKVKEKELAEYYQYKKEISHQIKIETFYISTSSLLNFFSLNTHKFFVILCFEKVKEWIFWNEAYTEKFINKLELILKNFHLLNKLNSYEIEYINHLKAVVFNKKRNLKQLVTDFPFLDKKELVCYNFTDVIVYKLNDNNELSKYISNCDIYLSNKRLIINLPSYVYSIHFNGIYSYKIENNLFRLDVFNRFCSDLLNKFYFDTDDNYVLYVSFQRVFNQFDS